MLHIYTLLHHGAEKKNNINLGQNYDPILLSRVGQIPAIANIRQRSLRYFGEFKPFCLCALFKGRQCIYNCKHLCDHFAFSAISLLKIYVHDAHGVSIPGALSPAGDHYNLVPAADEAALPPELQPALHAQVHVLQPVASHGL